MTEIFGWLGSMGTAFVEIFPQRRIICTTERGIFWRYGKSPRLLEPGIYWYWPLFSVLEKFEVVCDTIDICKQSIDNDKNETIAVSGWITYSISDPFTIGTEFTDHENTIQETAAGVISAVVNEGGMIPIEELSDKLIAGIKETKIGQCIEIEDFSVSDYFKVQHSLLQWQP